MAASTSAPSRRPAGQAPRCTASASSSAPSREPRIRRSGQVSSWTPATTTTSHSRPLDRCAVRMRTQSSRTARSASVSPAISCPDRLSANRPGAPGGMLSAKCAALSNRASTASRSRSAAAPAGPPAALRSCHCAARPEASQMAQSTSSALPPFLMASLAVASSPATRLAGPATRSGTTARSRGSSSAWTSMSPLGGWPGLPGSASASSCRDRRRRRRPRASVPPSGPQRSSAAACSSSSAGRSAQRSSISSGRVPGSSASGSSSPATATGTLAAVSARRSSGTCLVAERTRTAIDDQGTPSAR